MGWSTRAILLPVLLLPTTDGLHAAAIGAGRGGGTIRSLPLPPPPLAARRRLPTARCSLSSPPPASSGLVAVQRTLGEWMERSRSVKCPFWRRRTGDAVTSLIAVCEFVGARHKSILDRQWLPGSEASLFEPLALPVQPMGEKTRGLSVDAVMDVVRRDFESGQYYVSGQLSQAVYEDACFFDGPDPDMPVRSLARYSDALKGLFDPELSSIELVHMCPDGERSFVAHWRLSGALKLPWRPQIKPYAGATRYELNEAGLIASHTETWSIPVVDAFASMVLPGYGAPPAPSVERHSYVEPPPPRMSA